MDLKLIKQHDQHLQKTFEFNRLFFFLSFCGAGGGVRVTSEVPRVLLLNPSRLPPDNGDPIVGGHVSAPRKKGSRIARIRGFLPSLF